MCRNGCCFRKWFIFRFRSPGAGVDYGRLEGVGLRFEQFGRRLVCHQRGTCGNRRFESRTLGDRPGADSDGKGKDVKEEVQGALALSLAKASAIVPGQVLTAEEMNNLVDELFAVPTPNYTPDGKQCLSC